ncbi:MAG TPA: glycoside hydrolase family 95 protein [Fimbriimonadaceae bacterium]|nr:glycoside hydrolase family 95 protein [Fimbriimonadaceae bacterium]
MSHDEKPCSRRTFMQAASLATLALSLDPSFTMASLVPDDAVERGVPSPLLLWSDRPAQQWMTEAYPIGNGPMGAMLFGGTEIERIQFNEISLWSGARMAVDGVGDEGQDLGAYQAFGDVFIHLGHKFENITGYRRELDIAKAIHRVTYEHEGVRYEQSAFAGHPDRVVVVRISANKPGAISGRLELADMHGAKVVAEDRRLRSTGAIGNGFEYEAILEVLHQGGNVAIVRDRKSPGNPWNIETPPGGLLLEKCDSVTLILSAGTNFVQDHTRQWLGEHPHQAVTRRIENAARLGFEKLRARHLKDFRALFERFSIDLGTTETAQAAKTTLARLQAYVQDKASDPALEALFCQFGRYLLISCSRPGSLPANLQGVWNDSNEPEWACDYHSNINLQMAYWPAEPTNLAECHRPLIDYVDSIREVSAKNTQRKYGKVRGWTVQTMNNACGVSFWKWNPPGSAWYAQHLWEHFAFGQDKNYLRSIAYPIIKEVCAFWEDRLEQRSDGTLVVPDGWSPEHGPAEPGVSYDQQIVYDLFTNAMAAADALGQDREFRERIAGMRSRLLKPKIGRWGQLQEWETDRDDPKDTHRHVSHLFAVFPGSQITKAGTPRLAEAARISLNARGDESTGWSRAWKINFWARLWDGDRAYKLLRSLLTLTHETKTIYGERGGGVYSNLLDAHPPFQIDGNLGATAGYCEMLVQSHAGQIHLLPALPAAWPKGRVVGLCARGGFEVDVTWEEGRLVEATIRSKRGLPCRVVYGNQTWNLVTEAGKAYRLKPD